MTAPLDDAALSFVGCPANSVTDRTSRRNTWPAISYLMVTKPLEARVFARQGKRHIQIVDFQILDAVFDSSGKVVRASEAGTWRIN